MRQSPKQPKALMTTIKSMSSFTFKDVILFIIVVIATICGVFASIHLIKDVFIYWWNNPELTEMQLAQANNNLLFFGLFLASTLTAYLALSALEN